MREQAHSRSRAWRLVFWAGLAVTCAVYAAMLLWTLPEIRRAAGGQAPFDMRPLGYDAEAARTLLSALTAEGRSLYLGAQQQLDFVYPALLAATLSLALWRLAAPWPRAVRSALVALPVAAAVFDYGENARVRGLLQADPDAVGAEAVAAASRASATKALLSAASFAAVPGLLAWRGVRRFRGREGA